ncbi:MAG: hypothetical protein AAB731_00565 [Patescibacteria group bacterium]
MKKNLTIIIATAVIAAVIAGLFFFFRFSAKENNAPLAYTTFTTDEGFAVEYPNWQKLNITNPEEGMPADLTAKENLKILIYATNGAAVVQISERTFDPKKSFKDIIEGMIKNQRESVKNLIIWRNDIGASSALLETKSILNGIKMHTISKAFYVGNGKVYSVAFISADESYNFFKPIAEHIIYSAKVWR